MVGRKRKTGVLSSKKEVIRSFGRRKAGIMKKAHELSVLCGIQVAVVIFGPDKGIPHVWPQSPEELHPIIGRYLNTSPDQRKSNRALNMSDFINEGTAEPEEEEDPSDDEETVEIIKAKDSTFLVDDNDGFSVEELMHLAGGNLEQETEGKDSTCCVDDIESFSVEQFIDSVVGNLEQETGDVKEGKYSTCVNDIESFLVEELMDNSEEETAGEKVDHKDTVYADVTDGFSAEQLVDLLGNLDAKLEMVNNRIDMIKRADHQNPVEVGDILQCENLMMDNCQNPVEVGDILQCDNQMMNNMQSEEMSLPLNLNLDCQYLVDGHDHFCSGGSCKPFIGDFVGGDAGVMGMQEAAQSSWYYCLAPWEKMLM